ncbi:helix-turn-helix transcriptional regulator [Actinomycetospora soli]|uniref:helix-turn-helix transcriptional regulator n=1 Tax=Actinomycetospora soli TaxID=2893887 RepID=UPI001E46BF98|nr:LuxR family transcriptional regulator [Actinomycetospora soli]MCD2187338.1 LuxR C-terminal-related transcriptional regulator [Actinomycetospora soli]
MSGGWPFTGREDELARASSALADHGAVVLVGAAGVGKSRLARELLDRLGRAHVLGIVRATASARELPLGALLDVLPEVSADLSGLQRAVASLGPRDGRDVLLVDDAHLLDELSAVAVGRLVGRGVRLVLTARSGEPAPEAVTALWKDDVAARLDVGPLDRERTVAALAGALGAPVEPVTARRLHDISGGNLLWLRHLVDGERAAGHLRVENGSWVWSGEVTLSPVLTDLVGARLAGLSGPQQRVLELLAVVEPLDLDLLERLAGADAVEETAQRALVALEEAGDRWDARPAHPLYGEVVRSRLGIPRARRLRAELSDALAGAADTDGGRVGDDLRRAVLSLDNGRRPDPHLLLTAARQASGLSDFALAERLLRAAIGAGGGFDARAALAALLVYLLRADEADALLAVAAEEAADQDEVTRAVLLRTLVAHFGASGSDALDGGEHVLREAEQRSAATTGPAPEDPRYDGIRCVIAACRGEVTAATVRGERVLAAPDPNDDDVVLVSWGLGYARALVGDGRPPADLVERGLAAALRGRVMVNYAGNLAFSEILDAHLRGEPEAARRRLAWARGLPGAEGALWVALFEGRLGSVFGSPRSAVPALEGVLTVFPGHGGGWAAWLLALVAQCHGMLGDAAAARAALAAAEDRRHPQVAMTEFEIDLARAWGHAAAGARQDAVDTARRAAERCRAVGIAAAEVFARQTAVRLGDHDQAARLRELDEQVGSPRSRLAADHAAAAGDHEQLLAVAGRLERAGMRPEAADAAAQAAAAARVDGGLVAAAEAERRARRLAAACEGLRTPALDAAGTPVVLSAREREIAHLAGEGLTNRQIAGRLQVSVRTVESHIYRACSRLGLSDRAALVVVAGPRPDGPA